MSSRSPFRAGGFPAKAAGLYKKYEYLLFALAFLAVAAAMRICNFGHRSNDYNNFLAVWFDEIKAAGGLSGFASTVGDYTPMYKYIITFLTLLPFDSLYSYKAVSCLFDVILAVYAGLTVRHLKGSDLAGLLAYAAILFLPNVFLNSAVWAQCDAIFSCFCIMSFYYMLRGKGRLSMVFYAVAFSFKLQAIFYAPVVVVALLRKKLKLTDLLFFPLTYFLCGLPAWIAGMSFYDAYFGAYVTQVGEYSTLAMNVPNLYQLLPANYADGNLSRMLIFFAVGVCAIFCLFFYRANYRDSDRNWLIIAYTMTMVLPFVLPHMHERYFYLADIFAVLFAFTFKKKAYISAASIYCSLRVVIAYLYGGRDLSYPLLSCLELAAIVLLVLFALQELRPTAEKGPVPLTPPPKKKDPE